MDVVREINGLCGPLVMYQNTSSSESGFCEWMAKIVCDAAAHRGISEDQELSLTEEQLADLTSTTRVVTCSLPKSFALVLVLSAAKNESFQNLVGEAQHSGSAATNVQGNGKLIMDSFISSIERSILDSPDNLGFPGDKNGALRAFRRIFVSKSLSESFSQICRSCKCFFRRVPKDAEQQFPMTIIQSCLQTVSSSLPIELAWRSILTAAQLQGASMLCLFLQELPKHITENTIEMLCSLLRLGCAPFITCVAIATSTTGTDQLDWPVPVFITPSDAALLELVACVSSSAIVHCGLVVFDTPIISIAGLTNSHHASSNALLRRLSVQTNLMDLETELSSEKLSQVADWSDGDKQEGSMEQLPSWVPCYPALEGDLLAIPLV